MTKVALLAFLVLLVVPAIGEGAISPGRLPNPPPVTPAPPVASGDVASSAERMHLDIWREPCRDGTLLSAASEGDSHLDGSGPVTMFNRFRHPSGRGAVQYSAPRFTDR